MTPSGNPEDIAARYLAHLTAEGVKALADKIRAHRAAVLTDPEGFQTEQQIRSTPEYKSYKRYVKDRQLRIAVMAGLLLRKLETTPNSQQRVDDVLQGLHKIGGRVGRRQAEFVPYPIS